MRRYGWIDFLGSSPNELQDFNSILFIGLANMVEERGPSLSSKNFVHIIQKAQRVYTLPV
jgi:hypothetical protein